MLEGNSRVHIQAFELSHPKNSRGKPDTDQPKESHSIYDDYRDTTFPIRGPIPVETGVSPAAFKSKFLHIVANEISWHFVDARPRGRHPGREVRRPEVAIAIGGPTGEVSDRRGEEFALPTDRLLAWLTAGSGSPSAFSGAVMAISAR